MDDVSVAEEAGSAVSSEAEHAMLRISQGVLLLIAELGAPCVGNEFEEESGDPGTETSSDGNGPVLTSETFLADLQSVGTDLNNESLSTEDADPDNKENGVSKNAFEDILLIVDFATVDQVEDLHDSEDVENISHVSACTELLFLLLPQGSAVPIIDTTRVYKFVRSAESQSLIRLRVEVFTSEDNGVNNDDHVDSHGDHILDHLSGDNVLISGIRGSVEKVECGLLSGKSK